MSIHNYSNPGATKSWADIIGVDDISATRVIVDDLQVNNFVVGSIGSGDWALVPASFINLTGITNITVLEARWKRINNLVEARVKILCDVTIIGPISFELDDLPVAKTSTFTSADGAQGEGVFGQGGAPYPIDFGELAGTKRIVGGADSPAALNGNVANFVIRYTTD